MREGVVVPAFSVPDHITFDGKACFYPGSYETGERQGGAPWGKYPPLDDGFSFLRMVHEHWRLTRDVGLFRGMVRTSFDERTLSELCERVYACAPADAETGLVTAGDIDTENAKDWGFCDSVFKSGRLLFPSVLKVRAARGMAEVFAGAGDGKRAARYRDEAVRIAGAIAPALLHASDDGSEAWLHSATGVGNQADVWGSAFAVHSGVLADADAAMVSRALARACRERTAVRDGLVRHLLTTDPLNGGGWERSVSGLGEYQNGGSWGTPAGWYIAAVHRTDPALAGQMAAEFVGFLRRHMREDGTAEAWEWVNEEKGRRANPLYVATVALPYLSLQEAGLLTLLNTA